MLKLFRSKEDIKREVGKGMMRMETLLGDLKIIKHILEYIRKIGRLV